MKLYLLHLITISGTVTNISCLITEEPKTCYNRFEYEYNVLQKLVVLEEESLKQGLADTKLTKDIKDTKEVLKDLITKLNQTDRSRDGSTYTRWGRTECPAGAFLVYAGFVAGNHYTHSGSGVNYLCLPPDPIWGSYTEGFQSADRVYGAEYHTSGYTDWEKLNGHDVPCAICRIPRNNVLMIPGRNKCYKDFNLEYSGYLMGGHYSHAGASEYVCVDAEPETTDAGHEMRNEKYIFLSKLLVVLLNAHRTQTLESLPVQFVPILQVYNLYLIIMGILKTRIKMDGTIELIYAV